MRREADSSQPMPRARNHIAALTEQHERQSTKIAELERLIAEVSWILPGFLRAGLMSSYRIPQRESQTLNLPPLPLHPSRR